MEKLNAKNFNEILFEGVIVRHKIYGEGIIFKLDKKHIKISFFANNRNRYVNNKIFYNFNKLIPNLEI